MKKFLFAVAATALLSGTAYAAPTDGTLGTTSTGSLDVQVNVAPMVSIRGLDDITLNINPATLASNFGHTDGRTQFCVYSNANAAGGYQVNVSGVASSDTANPYALAGATSGTTLNHTVGYYDNATYNSVAASFMRNSLTKEMENTRGGQSRATDLDCASGGLGGSNASLQVSVRNAVALAALADTYRGTLQVTVSLP